MIRHPSRVPPLPDKAIRMSGVSKSFWNGSEKTTVLNQVDFHAAGGELVFIVGPSGCGKTTLLSVLCGTLDADSGEVEAFGHRLDEMPAASVTRFRAHHVGFIFQQFNLLSTLTVAENVALPLRIQGVPSFKAHARALEMLDRVGIPEKANDRPTTLSGGQQQRVSIARALVHEPSLVVCDEPTSALDSGTGHQVMELLHAVSRCDSRTVIVVTHDPRIHAYADRILEMEDGRFITTRQPK